MKKKDNKTLPLEMEEELSGFDEKAEVENGNEKT